MCVNKVNIISKVKSGQLSFCSACGIYHLEFNNIYLEFNQEEFDHFKMYIIGIEVEYWEHKYNCTKMKRKIPIPTVQDKLLLVFNSFEIKELQLLFSGNNFKLVNTINLCDIDYTLILN